MSSLIRSARDNPRLKQLKQQRDAGMLSPTDYQAQCTLVFRGLERGGSARRHVDWLIYSPPYDYDRRVYSPRPVEREPRDHQEQRCPSHT
jgi:hypothetical protein